MDLNPKQREAVNYGPGPLLIVAGAGSGKTRTLTSRLIKILSGGATPESIVAITFTNKAAEEMRIRVTNNLRLMTNDKKVMSHKSLVISQPFIGTFHSLGARLLRENARVFNRTRGFTIFDDDDSMSLMKRLAKDFNLNKERYKLPVISSQISKVKSLLVLPQELLDNRELSFYEIYETALQKNNAFDFDDLIEKVVRLFRENPAILEKYSSQFKYILIDEYQDVNPAQYQMVKLLAGKHKNISVVGDDSQSIYKFRGSDFTNFLNFEGDWPNAKIVKLEQNYRSTANIITAASHLIGHNKLQRKKNLWTENHEGELIKVISAENAYEEASFIANAIKQFPISNFQFPKNQTTAILYRTNAQSRSIEQALISENIPYKIFGGVKFYQRKEIKDLVAALRLVANPKDEVSAERIIDTLPKAMARDLVTELKAVGNKLAILEIINLFLTRGKYFDFLEHKFQNADERVENINEFIVFASEFTDLNQFLERVSLLQSTDTLNPTPHTLNPINLMSIHLAKGLEFDHVFIIGANEGLMPHRMSYGSLDELEEERRLMYVAMTRARQNLHISFYDLPSRFLYEIPPELTEFVNLTGDETELPDEENLYID